MPAAIMLALLMARFSSADYARSRPVIARRRPSLRLFEVLAIGSTFEVRHTLLSRDLAVSDDARLEISDQGIDLVEAQHARGRLQIVGRGAQRPPVACP